LKAAAELEEEIIPKDENTFIIINSIGKQSV
jgi:hypothetical protein